MNVVVLVPYRPSTPERVAAFSKVRTHMQHVLPDAPLHAVDDGGSPFSRAGSINHGVRNHQADIYVVPDADVLAPAAQIREAVNLAAEPGVVQPFDEYLYLTRDQSEAIDPPDLPESPEVAWDTRPTVKVPLVGAFNVFSHRTWEATGGLLQLRGWGCQDLCWDAMCATFVAPMRRVPGPLLHLWHPHDDHTRRPRDRNPELMARAETMTRLRSLIGKPGEMRAELERLGHALPPA